ncbi:Pycsar system effector family protein [Planotetraspora phitsanulokensis]|uniref:Pycsar system effector family protein n=1 Tax=Planotetraspora phitsanulokensis TaxID=575192 RepID=UPI00195027FC|nr:Pycsar system effector family protein [Planotetraspora phitsanulokensis]
MWLERKKVPEPDSADAHFAISQFSAWIMNADTKAGVLAAALAILINGLLGQKIAITALLPPRNVAAWLPLTALTGSAICIIAASMHLILAVRPKIRQDEFSRYSWPSVSKSTISQLVSRGTDTDREEAWKTAHTLASIAEIKFRRLRVAFIWWLIAALLLLLGIASLP